MAAVPRFVRENEELVEASLRTTYSGQVLMIMILLIIKLRQPNLPNHDGDDWDLISIIQAASQWLELRLQLLGCAVVAGVAVIAVNKIIYLK